MIDRQPMSTDQRIAQALDAAFAQHRSVFWHDVDAEFATSVATLDIGESVQLVRVDEVPALQVKLDIEAALQTSGHQRWLLYSNRPEPEPAADWLLDVRMRSKSFRADGTSMLLEDLGLTTLTLAPHLKLRSKFLRAKDRVDRLKRLVLPGDDAESLDRKMMAVVLRCDDTDALALAMRLLHGLWIPGEAQIADVPKGWGDLISMELADAFWEQMNRHLGYSDPNPSLGDLLLRVLVTDLARHLHSGCPPALQQFMLPNRVLAANASVLAARWRSDLQLHKSYAELSAAAGDALKLDQALSSLQVEELEDCITFASVERRIIGSLKARLTREGPAVLDSLRPLVARRRNGPWVNPMLAVASPETQALAGCYDALEAAAEFLALKDRHACGLSFATADDGVTQYRDTLFAFDQLYRRFHHASDQVEPMGWKVLHDLGEVVEQAYSGWFMPQLSSAWAKVLEGPDGLLNRWQLVTLPPQQRFFDDRVAGSNKRIFVVISDAMRYEVAEELTREINGTNRLSAKLDAMLGVLPSYTTLGMAALLPHHTLEYRDNGSVYADGLSTATVEARDTLLSRYSGMAIKADELIALGKEKGRERVREQRVVYVYHDRIDMLGDKQVSESQTFEAVADTLTELQALVSFIVNNLNGSAVLVTADHGFIYQESALDEADKASLGDKPQGTLVAKKRYLLGKGLPHKPSAWTGNTSITAGTTEGDASLDFWVPKGTARFHFVGGARFVHGSAMPQEVIVPVVTVRGSEAASAKTRQVELSLLGASNKVVTNKQRFEFLQSEAVTERVLPRTVQISLRDGPDLISDEAVLTLNSTSTSMNDWKHSAILTIRSGSYDRQRDYHLVARDVQSKVEVLRMPVRIDLAFSNDF